MSPSALLQRWLVPLGLALGLVPIAAAAGAGDMASATVAAGDARALLVRMHGAATGRSYQGTMVFTTGGVVSSTRVAHFCVGDQVYERIEALDGRQRQVFRHNDLVHTVWPQSGVAVVERRLQQPLGLPSSTQAVEPRALEQYELRPEGRDRVAGRDAVVVLLQPRDDLRFAQRIWADVQTGLMLRSDVVGPARMVLESSAFSEVEVDVAPQPDSVLQAMRRIDALRVLRPTFTATRLESEGWSWVRPVPGFRLSGCVRRPADLRAPPDVPAGRPEVLQAVFSDGLTHVSLFIESFDPARHRKPLQAQFGATHSLALRRGEHWITAMGDVPEATLRAFVEGLERRP